MKQKISVSIDEEKLKDLDNFIESGLFRSKSHVIEYSLTKFLKESKNG